MSNELNSIYPNVFKFIGAIKTFEKIYEENKNPEIDFTNFLLKITIIDNFITTVFEKVDFQTSLEIVKKIKLDPEFMIKNIDNMVSDNNELIFTTKNKVQTFETLEKTATGIDIDSDHSSVSSIEDINSNNSEISDQEDESQKELSIQTKKMLASSLVELNIRKKDKDYNTTKVEEED
jgi:hypothetical protein